MRTDFSSSFLNTKTGERANTILRSCVHCGFCNATCPTHQVTGDELDGPRGRIYLIKEMLEAQQATETTLTHLDSCLTCMSCETTCPSGVRFGELIEIGKEFIDNQNVRSLSSRIKRWLVRNIFPYPSRFAPWYFLGRIFGLVKPVKININAITANSTPKRNVILLSGCVQSIVATNINEKLTSLLADVGVKTLSPKSATCCGAIEHHNGSPDRAIQRAKNNIDAWWPLIEQGAEALVMTASGCGSMLKDYERLLANEPDYADKAKRITKMTLDASEYLENFTFQKNSNDQHSIAFHSPCTLQHDQKVIGVIEKILSKSGYTLTTFKDSHLCCGSAGTYSLLQPEMALQLRNNKISHIEQSNPTIIATANIGCLLHLRQGTKIPVKHWLELIRT